MAIRIETDSLFRISKLDVVKQKYSYIIANWTVGTGVPKIMILQPKIVVAINVKKNVSHQIINVIMSIFQNLNVELILFKSFYLPCIFVCSTVSDKSRWTCTKLHKPFTPCASEIADHVRLHNRVTTVRLQISASYHFISTAPNIDWLTSTRTLVWMKNVLVGVNEEKRRRSHSHYVNNFVFVFVFQGNFFFKSHTYLMRYDFNDLFHFFFHFN